MDTKKSSERKALIIIDMQKGSFTPGNPRHNGSDVIEKINRLAEIMTEKEIPVIFIQHDGSKENEYVPGTKDWEILDEMDIKPLDLIVKKTANDAFYKSDLQSVLINHKLMN